MTLLKIGVTGTIHAGKSTFINDLKQKIQVQGHKAIVVDEVARSCPLPINQEVYLKSEMWMALTQITKEIEKSYNTPYNDTTTIVLTDRTILDNFAFCMSFQIRKRKKYVGTSILKEILNYWMHTYDTIFYLKPLPLPIEDDGVRSTDPGWQREIDRIIQSTIQHYRLNNNIIYTIHTTDREERVKQAMLHLIPILEQHSKKKTFYPTTGMVQEQIPVQEAIL